MNLRPACQPGPYRMASSFLGCVVRQVRYKKRTRPNKAHVSAKDVPELRQFVQAGTAQPSAESCQSLRISQCRAGNAFCFIAHRSEFEAGERSFMQPWSPLPKQNRITHRVSDRHGNQGYNGCENEQRQGCHTTIENPLSRLVQTFPKYYMP